MTRGDLINERARAGAVVYEAREKLARISVKNTIDRAIAKTQLDDALAYYAQCLWEEKHWQATIAAAGRSK
jgi:hypothetical protein